MKTTGRAGLVVFLFAVSGCSHAFGAEGPARGQATREELLQRIAELEKAIGDLETEVETEMEASLVHAGASGPFLTAAAGEAGRRHEAGATDPEVLARIRRLIEATDGPGLLAELEKHIVAGEKGYAVLVDVLRRLDQERRNAMVFVGRYPLLYAVTHLAMLYEAELAELVHYYLAATALETRSFMRLRMYDYIPVFLEFHRGRFPDLEAAFQEEITMLLDRGDGDFQRLFRAARALDFAPPLPVVEKFLRTADSMVRAYAGIQHLESRNDAEAVAALVRFVESHPRSLRAGLAALAGMTVPEAASMLARFLASPDREVRRAAVFGYFEPPRGEEGLSVALEYLNSAEDLGVKQALVREFRYRNKGFFEILKENAARIDDQAVRAAVNR